MAPLEDKVLKSEPFYQFVTDTLGETIKIYSLAGDASSRRYYRIVKDNESWVLMKWEPFTDDGSYPFLSVLRHFSKHGVHVPDVKALSEKLGVILLEDLGDLTLERKFWESRNQETIIPFYKLAIDELVKIHITATEDKTDCTAFSLAFDEEKLLWEMNYCKTHLLEEFCGLALSETDKSLLKETFTSVIKRITEYPMCLVHRDYHSRNLMMKFDKMRVIDFQDARLGAPQYDLVSLLKDSYVNLSDTIAESLLDYYILKTKDRFPYTFNKEQFDEVYELQSIQRCFKACGSFASFYNMRQDTRYLKYIKPTLRQVLRSVGSFPEYRSFAKFLEDKDLLNREYMK